MSNNTTEIKISRSASPYSSRSNALIALDGYNFHPGELVAVSYNTDPNNLNVLFAVGIEGGGYKLVSLLQNKMVRKVYYVEPSGDKTDLLWTNGERWYIGDDPLSLYPGIIINDADSQTFFAVSLDGQTPRQINNVYDREELIEKTGTIISKIVQSDWNERNMLAPSYIQHKPTNLSSFEEDLRYSLVSLPSSNPSFLVYGLQKVKGTAEPSIVGDPITILYDSSIVSGEVKSVTSEDKQPGGIFYEEDEYEVGDFFLDFLINIGTDTYTHIYVLIKSLTDIYTPGLGIDINEDKQVSLQVISQRGLRVDPENGLTIDPASSVSSGAMTSLEKQKLDALTEEDYALVSDIVSGIIEPRVSKTSLTIESPPSDYRISETPGFYMRPCTGVETGDAEILQINGGEVGYNNKNQLLFCYPKLVSVGNNSCDPSSALNSYKIDSSTGNLTYDSSYSVAFFRCFFTPYSIFSRVDDNLVIGFAGDGPTSTPYPVLQILTPDEHGLYNPPSSGYLYISTGLMEVSDVCARISGDGAMDDVYEPYTKTVLDMGDWEDKPAYIGEYLYGSDSINNVEGNLVCTKHWGFKEFQVSDWGTIQSEVVLEDSISVTRYYYQYNFPSEDPSLVKSDTTEEILMEEYNSTDEIWIKTEPEDAEIIITSSGFRYYVPTTDTPLRTLRLTYELDQPLTFNTGVSAIFPVYKYGLEIFGVSESDPIPSLVKTRNKPNLLSDLINIRPELQKKISKYSVDDVMSDSSKNPVQCKVVKSYVDSLVSSYSSSDAGDLSKQDFYGAPKLMNTANCYIVTRYTSSDSGSYRFPLVYGNGIKNGVDNERAYNNFTDYLGDSITSPWIDDSIISTTGILWKDSGCSVASPSIITSSGHKYISFSTTTGEGNAVIYIKDSQNRIIWTWHIWEIGTSSNVSRLLNPVSIWNKIPAEGPTGGTEYMIMPVFLGFSGDGTSGVYYQWGRKDPFSSSSSPVISYTKSSTSNSIQNPQTLFLDNETWNSSGNIQNYWNYNNAAPNSFGDYNTGKTIYDPCPAGWKVPCSNVFRGFTTTGTQIGQPNIKGAYRPGLSTPSLCGYDFKHTYEDNTPSLDTPFFQAIGFMDSTIKNTGTNGYYWSAVQGCSLEFSDSIINPVKSGTNISYGFPIHPILE